MSNPRSRAVAIMQSPRTTVRGLFFAAGNGSLRLGDDAADLFAVEGAQGLRPDVSLRCQVDQQTGGGLFIGGVEEDGAVVGADGPEDVVDGHAGLLCLLDKGIGAFRRVLEVLHPLFREVYER